MVTNVILIVLCLILLKYIRANRKEHNFLYSLIEMYFDCEIKARVEIENYLIIKFPDFMKHKYPSTDMTDEEFKEWIKSPPKEGKEKPHPGNLRFYNKEIKIRIKMLEESDEYKMVNDSVHALASIIEKKKVE